MDSIRIYDDFIERHKDFPSYLARLISSERGNLPPSRETAAYNLGTMQKDADIAFSDNIAVANAHRFQTEFNRYKTENPQMGDTEARARIIFDFLQQNHSPFSYDKNKTANKTTKSTPNPAQNQKLLLSFNLFRSIY